MKHYVDLATEKNMVSDLWQDFSKQIEDEIEDRGEKTHLSWPVVNFSMLRGFTDESLHEAFESYSVFGGRLPFLENGSQVQQVHLLAMAQEHGIDIESVETIVEIGAGLLPMFIISQDRDLFPNLREYIIYDLPSVIKIQISILSAWDQEVAPQLISTMQEFSEIDLSDRYHLLVSCCAYSEMPLFARESLKNANPGVFSRYAMRVQKMHDKINNIEHLRESIPPSWVGDCVFVNHSYVIKCP
ncbi:MAG: hypothetical protein ACYSWP_08250 [Planctomycetota bacterium]